MYNMSVSTNSENLSSVEEFEPEDKWKNFLAGDSDEMMYCFGCGAPLKWGDEKCPSCGTYQ